MVSNQRPLSIFIVFIYFWANRLFPLYYFTLKPSLSIKRWLEKLFNILLLFFSIFLNLGQLVTNKLFETSPISKAYMSVTTHVASTFMGSVTQRCLNILNCTKCMFSVDEQTISDLFALLSLRHNLLVEFNASRLHLQ